MSYELIFWRTTAGSFPDPQAVYKALCQEEEVPPGLAELPIEEFIEAVSHAFPVSVREPNGKGEWLIWVDPDDSKMFEMTWSAWHVRFDCRALTGDQMNRLIDVGTAFGCPLYDPQTSERFRL